MVELAQPDATFLQIVAINFFFAVPVLIPVHYEHVYAKDTE